MGRSHDYFCHDCKTYWSPFDFDKCPCGSDNSEYDINHEWINMNHPNVGEVTVKVKDTKDLEEYTKATNVRIIKEYAHGGPGNRDEYSDLWPQEAEQQTIFHYCLYEVEFTIAVDLDTGNSWIIAVNGIDLVQPVKA